MLNDLNLSGVEVLVFSILCSIGGTTASQLSEFTGMNERTTTYTLNKLVEKECVVKTGGITNGKRTPIYYAVKRDYEIWYEKSCEKLYEISYQREKEAKREDIKEDYLISNSLIKENEDRGNDIDCTSNNTKDIKSKGIDNKSANDIQKEKTNRFIPPTVEQVREYCKTRNNDIDAESFIDFYKQKNWMIGKNKMQDWKAAVRTWEHRRKEKEREKEKEKEPKKYAYKLDEVF